MTATPTHKLLQAEYYRLLPVCTN